MSRLSVENLSLSFGGLKVLSAVSIDADAGEIVGIIGPNGAGKTTLVNAICGIHAPDAGRITLGGTPTAGLKPSAVAALGLRRTFQTSHLFVGMSVLENMMAGLHLGTRAGLFAAALRTRSMRAEEQEAISRSRAALRYVGMEEFAGRPGGALSFGQQRVIEIARTLIDNPRVILLDEPAVGLSPPRVAELDALLRRIRTERGVTLIMIEHVIRLVMDVCDRVVVLNSGRVIASGPPHAVRRNPEVIEAYLGSEFDARRPPSQRLV
jgi:branched-chain amino acid transport system ATP-binding protein